MGTTPARWQTYDQLTSLFIARLILLFRRPRPYLGVGVPPPSHLPPYCDRVSQQRQTESLECFESNHLQFYYLRSYFDLARKGQTKMLLFSKINVFANNF